MPVPEELSNCITKNEIDKTEAAKLRQVLTDIVKDFFIKSGNSATYSEIDSYVDEILTEYIIETIYKGRTKLGEYREKLKAKQISEEEFEQTRKEYGNKVDKYLTALNHHTSVPYFVISHREQF